MYVALPTQWQEAWQSFTLPLFSCFPGEVLRGDRIVNTPFQVSMNVEKKCEVLCNFPNKPVTLTVEQSKLIAERIREDYYVHL